MWLPFFNDFNYERRFHEKTKNEKKNSYFLDFDFTKFLFKQELMPFNIEIFGLAIPLLKALDVHI